MVPPNFGLPNIVTPHIPSTADTGNFSLFKILWESDLRSGHLNAVNTGH